jgi:hypothetical protein
VLRVQTHMHCILYLRRDTSTFRGKISSDKWIDHSRTAFAVDPRIALSMTMRFPTNAALQSEITQLVQVWFLQIAVLSRYSFALGTFYLHIQVLF